MQPFLIKNRGISGKRWTISISAEESRRGLHQGSYARQWFEKYTRHGQRGQDVSHVLIPRYASRVDHIGYTNAYAENHSSVVNGSQDGHVEYEELDWDEKLAG